MSVEAVSPRLPEILGNSLSKPESRNNNVENHKINDFVTPAIHKNGIMVTQDDLTDDNESDSPQNSEGSAIVSGSDDIIFDDDTSISGEVTRSNSVDYIKVKAIDMLQQELKAARKELMLKDEQCKELADVRVKLESELEELTASLFEEAHKMVHDANMKQFVAEKKRKEAAGEIEALQIEIEALKSLVLTSTPSNPNPQLHPQLIKKKGLNSPIRRPKKSKSVSENQSPIKRVEDRSTKPVIKMGKEVDLVVMVQLTDWLDELQAPPTTIDSQSDVSNHNDTEQTNCDRIKLSLTSKLLERIHTEDIVPCLTFPPSTLSSDVLKYIETNALTIEPLSKPVYQTCSLSGLTSWCKHRIRCEGSDEWFTISQSSRGRIASVCDFLTYIRYIKQGLVKQSNEKIYWEINRLRREMALAKLGYFKEE